MLVKIKMRDQTLEFDSKDHLIAILFTPSDKQVVEKMKSEDLLFLTGPFKIMAQGAADAWHWAFNGWKGATFVDPKTAVSPTEMRKG